MSELSSLIKGSGFAVQLFHLGNQLDPTDDNVDIQVCLEGGVEYVATVATLLNLEKIMAVHRETGECVSGLYLYISDLVIVRELTPEAIMRSVEDLIETGEIESAMSRVDNSWLEGD